VYIRDCVIHDILLTDSRNVGVNKGTYNGEAVNHYTSSGCWINATKVGGSDPDPEPDGGDSIGNGRYAIKVRHSGMAMDVVGMRTDNGAPIQQYWYWGGSNQKWDIRDRGGREYSIIGVQSGKAIDVPNFGGAGTRAQIYSYWGGDNQKFTFHSKDGGYYTIRPAYHGGICLDVSDYSFDPGARIQTWWDWGGECQQWKLD
jgi:hypothetical protein